MAIPEEIQKQVLTEATSATPNYSINYEDEQFKKVDATYQNDMNDLQQTIGGMINDTDGFYKNLADQSQQWADKQAQIQQDNTDFAIEKIEQQKEQAQKDYLKEQSGAYVDWRKQSNQYGTEAEKMASAGLSNTGFSESSQVSMYNTYQQRVATAREVMSQAKLNYDNNIKEAMLQNNAALAEIYANSYKEQLQLALEGFQYKNQLVLDLADRKQRLEETKWNRYQDILHQMNTENALAEDIRQYNETQKWETEQAEINRQHQLERDKIQREFETKENELNRKHDFALLDAKTEKERQLAEEEHQRELAKLEKEKQNAIAILNQELANDKALSSFQKSLSSVGSSGGSVAKAVTNTAKKTTSGVSKSNTQKVSVSSAATPQLDMNNVLSLGYGPISASKLAQLVKEGKVEQYYENGKVKFRKVTAKKPTFRTDRLR